MTTSTRSRTSSHTRKGTLALAVGSLLALTFVLPASAAEAPVPMGTAQGFAVLAGTGITNTGTTNISGSNGASVGSSPTTTVSDLGVINVTNGVLYTEASGVVDGAKLDLVTAYDNAAGRTPPTETLVGPTLDLAGRTLTTGVYKSATSIGLTGTLTLDAQDDPNAVFIFQASTETLITGSGSSVVLINGAQACNVFWQVGSSATFGTGSSFVGTVMALTSISAQTGATFQGQLLARNGAVTLEGNTIVNDACVAAATPEPEPGPAPSPAPIPEDSTVDGGVIPETGAADWLAPLGFGLAVAIFAAALLLRNRRTD